MTRTMMRAAALAVATGLLVAICLSGHDLHWLAWIAWAPLFVAVLHVGVRGAAVCGFLAGLVETVCMLQWVPRTVVNLGRSGVLGVLLLTVLCLVWAANTAVFCVLVRHLVLRVALDASRPRLVYAIFGSAALWCGVELVATHVLRVVPWVHFFAGYSQWNRPLIIQVAGVGGVHAVSFLVISVNVALAVSLFRRSLRPLLMAAVVVLGGLGYGAYRLHLSTDGAPIRVAVLQGNVNPRQCLDPVNGERLARQYLGLSSEANAAGADLVVWTESAIPWPIEDGDDLVEAALDRTRAAQACHLIGTAIESVQQPGHYLNAAILVLADGRVTGQYSKVRPLVLAETPVCFPGGGASIKLHPSRSRFVPGHAQRVLSSPLGCLGVSICNENFYADLARRAVCRGAVLLVNLTNDGWFLHDAPLRQHFMVNPFRAVETRRPLVVANNVGRSAIIDGCGRVRLQSSMRTAACMVGDVVPVRGRSLYSRFSDTFTGVCGLCVVLAGMWHPGKGLRSRRET